MDIKKIYNEDCLKAMKEMKDNQFDLAIVDPPYSNCTKNLDNWLQDMKGKKAKIGVNRTESLKGNAPTKSYFVELKRISKNQIIWGVNWYDYILGVGRIVWDKDNKGSNFSDCEIAYNSIKTKLDLVKIRWNGMLQHDMKNKEQRIHPTQKPVKLYEWLLMNYAKEGDKILDTHLGSGSIAIACHNLGYDLEGYELDKEYFNNATKRIKQHQAQLRLI